METPELAILVGGKYDGETTTVTPSVNRLVQNEPVYAGSLTDAVISAQPNLKTWVYTRTATKNSNGATVFQIAN